MNCHALQLASFQCTNTVSVIPSSCLKSNKKLTFTTFPQTHSTVGGDTGSIKLLDRSATRRISTTAALPTAAGGRRAAGGSSEWRQALKNARGAAQWRHVKQAWVGLHMADEPRFIPLLCFSVSPFISFLRVPTELGLHKPQAHKLLQIGL